MMYEAYRVACRVLITVGCLIICMLAAIISPCFIPASIIASASFWKYFAIAFLASFVPLATV